MPPIHLHHYSLLPEGNTREKEVQAEGSETQGQLALHTQGDTLAGFILTGQGGEFLFT